MEPTRFERFVGDLLAAHLSCDVVHCGKSHDGGIDLILADSDIGHIPIQVKRRSTPGSVESVSLVREFRGAMLLKGYDRGILVTTADHFSNEAIEASTPSPQDLVEQCIDLIDCRRLLDILNVVARDGLVLPCLDHLIRHNRLPEPDDLRSIERQFGEFSQSLSVSLGSQSPSGSGAMRRRRSRGGAALDDSPKS
jgi:hypothetical protein